MSTGSPRSGFFLLCSGAAVMFASFFMFGPLAPLLGGALGAPPFVIGVVISAAFLFPFFLAVPAGSLVDGVGPRPMLLIGTGLLAAAPSLVVASPSLASLIVLQVMAGLGQLIAVVAAQSLVASYGGGRDRERNFGWYGAFVSGGQLIGPVLAGVLVDLAGFRVAFAVAAGLAALGMAMFLILPIPRRPPRARGTARRAAWVPPRELLRLTRLPTVQIGLWVSGTVMIVLIGHGSFLPAYLDELAMPASVIGLILSARSAASVLVRPFMAPLVAGLGGRFRTFLVAMVGSAVGIAGLAFGGHVGLLLAASILLGVSVGVAQPLTMVAVVEEVPASGHGVAFGLRITANRLVQFVAPLLLGLVAQLADYASMFLVASLAVLATAGLLQVRRMRYRAIDGEAGT